MKKKGSPSPDLAESHEFLHSLIENLPNMVFVKDAKDLRFIRFNKAGESLIGYSHEELLGKNDYDFFPKAQERFRLVREEMTHGGVIRVESEEGKGSEFIVTLRLHP